jgi:nucleotide-binding universal stress UspA family protein
MKILIAADVAHSYIDRTDKNWFDVEQLANLVPLQGSEISLIYVKEELPSYERVLATQADFPGDIGNAIEVQARPVLTELATRLEGHGATVTIEIVTGPTAYMIEQAALDEQKDLVVIATRSDGDEHAVFGGTATHVARHAPCSTLILRHSAKAVSKVDTVLVALDGSENCLVAVENAMRSLNGRISDKKIYLIHVANVSTMVAAVTPRAFVVAMEENLMMEGEIYLANASKTLQEHGFKNIEIMLKTGLPTNEIITAAEKVNAQMIVVAAQGKGAIKHILMGEVANKIVTHAPVATLVARLPKSK